MKKIILGLFIILFCFSIGISEVQEEEPLKGEKLKAEVDRKAELYLKVLNRSRLEKLSKEELIIEILALKELFELERKIAKLYEESEKDVLELMKEASKPEEKYDFSWLDEIPEIGKTDAEKLEEENDRLEDLLEDLRSERSSLEWDMMRHRWDLENAKPDPLDYQMALDSAIASAMIAPNPFKYDSWFYPYYPSYLMKTDRTNYEPLLFTLCTDSKGKMDWTKYGWLKLLLKNK